MTDVSDLAEQSTSELVNQVLALGALSFGGFAILAPGALRRLYGMDVDSPELTYFGRMWGTRTAAIGALAYAATTDDERSQLASVAAAMNSADAFFAATTRGLPGRTRVMAGLTSAAFAAGAVLALLDD